MNAASLSKVLASSLIVATAITGSASAQAQNPPTLKANSVELATSRVFQTFGSGSQTLNDMGARLQDLQQRAVLRDEQRANIHKSHYGVAEALELNEATYEKLIDVLTDQQMEQLEEFHLRLVARAQTGGDPMGHLQTHAERLSRNLDTLRELLGQEKLERYQEIQLSLGERGEVRELDERLDASHKLSAAQRERLVELFRDHNARAMGQRVAMSYGRRSSLGTDVRELPSPEQMQRRSQLDTLAEGSWRRMPESNRQLREQAAEFLTAPQLSTLERLQAERLRQLQQRIEQMRVQAGLNPTIPDRPEAAETPPAAIAGEVKLSIKLAVNRAKPMYFTEAVGSGNSVTFEIDEGLVVEATPTLYDNDVYDLRVAYYEAGATGKRLIGNMSQSGRIMRAPPGDDSSRHLSGGGGSTVITGSKAYMIQMSAHVDAS